MLKTVLALPRPRLGYQSRIFVVDVDDALITVINPEITVSGEKIKMEEGSL